MRRSFWLLALSTSLSAQTDTPIRSPRIGYVYERGAGLRPILGVPGASSFGDTISIEADLQTAQISPEQDYAVALAGSEKAAVIIDLPSGRLRSIDGILSGVERIALSPSGTSAVLYRTDAHRIDIVTGLPANPARAWSRDLIEEPVALAVRDDGEEVLMAGAASVLRISRDGDQRHIAGAEVFSATYLRQSADILIAERSGRLLALRDSGEQPVLFTAEPGSFGDFVALAADSQRAYVASSSRVAAVPLSPGTAEVFDCACSITALERMSSAGVFRLTEPNSGPLWLFDGTRIVFVPAGGAQ